jgi:hypothetical protein
MNRENLVLLDELIDLDGLVVLDELMELDGLVVLDEVEVPYDLRLPDGLVDLDPRPKNFSSMRI